eukprot:s3411_g1.t1
MGTGRITAPTESFADQCHRSCRLSLRRDDVQRLPTTAPGDAEAKVPTPPRASPRGGVCAAEQRRHAHEQIVLDPFESRASQSSQRLTPRGPYPSPEGAEPHGVFRSRSATVSSSTGSDDLPSTKAWLL